MAGITLFVFLIPLIISSCNSELLEVPDQLIGNYFSTSGSDYWVYSIQKDFLISNCQFWKYSKIIVRSDEWNIKLKNKEGSKRIRINLSDSTNITINDDGLVNQCSRTPRTVYSMTGNNLISWQPDTAVVKGYVENYANEFDNESSILLYVDNYLTGARQSYSTQIDTLGRFEIKMRLLNSQDIRFHYQEIKKMLFISPSDTLMVFVNAHNPNEFHYMGNLAGVCYDIQQYASKIYGITSPKEMVYYLGKEPYEYRAYWDSVLSRQKDLLNEINNSGKCSDVYYLWQQKQIENRYYFEPMNFSWKSLKYSEPKNRLGSYHPYWSFVDSINQSDI